MIVVLIASLMAVRKLGEIVLRDTEDGEVVYDSILENKEKTKNFWEQMMMASAPRSRFISNLSDAEKIELTNEASEQDCFYARPIQVPDPLDVHMEIRTEKSEYFFRPETVVQREIRLQQEREAELARQREEALSSARSSAVATHVPTRQPSGKAAHILIEMELREMRDREEELRRLREQPTHRPDMVQLSQLDSLDGSTSRVLSPEEDTKDFFKPQESQMYCGVGELLSSKQPAVVKPLVEAEEEAVPAYMRSYKETPIEREIRLLQEREKELRRENGLYQHSSITSPPPAKSIPETHPVASHTINFNDRRSAEHRLATNRIHQEIYETTKREKELQSAGRIQTMSEDTLDSKVTRYTDLAEYAIEEKDRKLRKSVSSSNLPRSVSLDNSRPTASQCHSYNHNSSTPTNTYRTQMYIATVSPVISVDPKKPLPPMSKKGMMQKFLKSHGNVNGRSLAGRTDTPTQGIPEDEVDQIPIGTPSVVDWKGDVTSNFQDQSSTFTSVCPVSAKSAFHRKL
ncbi:uncharacterized protein [Anabrus simplex]|uniref:uncharacterized protein isoform X2 n=1 Tax=Anabrus simplex TaxID=316456 RepID=UPI0035A3A9FD